MLLGFTPQFSRHWGRVGCPRGRCICPSCHVYLPLLYIMLGGRLAACCSQARAAWSLVRCVRVHCAGYVQCKPTCPRFGRRMVWSGARWACCIGWSGGCTLRVLRCTGAMLRSSRWIVIFSMTCCLDLLTDCLFWPCHTCPRVHVYCMYVVCYLWTLGHLVYQSCRLQWFTSWHTDLLCLCLHCSSWLAWDATCTDLHRLTHAQQHTRETEAPILASKRSEMHYRSAGRVWARSRLRGVLCGACVCVCSSAVRGIGSMHGACNGAITLISGHHEC